MNWERLKKDIIRREGKRNTLYFCPEGYPTIGYGRNLVGNPLTEEELRVLARMKALSITDEGMDYLLDQNISSSVFELRKNFPWVEKLNHSRQVALLDMLYNLGLPRFRKFVLTLSLIKQGRYAEAAARLRSSLWARQVKRRAEEIARIIETGHEG